MGISRHVSRTGHLPPTCVRVHARNARAVVRHLLAASRARGFASERSARLSCLQRGKKVGSDFLNRLKQSHTEIQVALFSIQSETQSFTLAILSSFWKNARIVSSPRKSYRSLANFFRSWIYHNLEFFSPFKGIDPFEIYCTTFLLKWKIFKKSQRVVI